MTLTQLRILARLPSAESGEWWTATDVAFQCGLRVPGSAARHLRTLMAAGLVEQKQIAGSGRFPLFAYRKVADGSPTDPR